MDKYFLVSLEKEERDTDTLVTAIKEDKWIDRSTVIVNCFPEYSSRLAQTVNHKLSHLNKHELYEMINLEMPYPTTPQVWNPFSKAFEVFDTYLKVWVKENVFPNKFLFLSSGILTSKNFNKIRLSIKHSLESDNFRFATLYNQSDFIADYCVENPPTSKGLLFHWENMDNPNWGY